MIVGITGSFGSGKTTVAKMFAGMGAYVIDADKVYHSLIRPGKSCYKKIISRFGNDILNGSARINRRMLGQIVFKDRTKLNLLNALVQPEVIKAINGIINSRKRGFIIVEAPLLIESGFHKYVDKVILVANRREEQVKRIRSGRGMAGKETMKIIRMQMPFKKKQAFADFIIDNSGSKTQTLRQVRKIWKQIGE